MAKNNLQNGLNTVSAFYGKNKIYFVIIFVVLLLIAGIIVYQRLKNKDSYSKQSGRQVNKNNLSFTQLEFENMAQRIYDAMDGAGTNEDIIFSILRKLQNSDDWFKLVEVFGVRKIGSGYTLLAPWQMVTNKPKNLMQALTDEFNESEQEELSKLLQNLGVQY